MTYEWIVQFHKDVNKYTHEQTVGLMINHKPLWTNQRWMVRRIEDHVWTLDK